MVYLQIKIQHIDLLNSKYDINLCTPYKKIIKLN